LSSRAAARYMPRRNTNEGPMDGKFFEDLAVGQSASFAKTVTEADILMFAAVSGDTNPVHIDAEYAAGTMFKTRIAHGMLSAGLISAVLGTRLPGPGTVYLAQSLKFRAPVKLGDTVTATCTVASLDEAKKRATLTTICTVGGKPVIEGEATVMVPSRL
jgi:3-hydroxybutyryl-CoA dehydratase